MVVHYSTDSRKLALYAHREVIKETIEKSDTRLKRVNHLKGWGAKTLV